MRHDIKSWVAKFGTRVARLQNRDKGTDTVFKAQNSSARGFGRLSHACKAAEGYLAPISELRIHRRAFLDACRTLAKPQKAIWLRFQSSEFVDAPFSTLVARLQSRRRLSGSDFRAQNPSTRLFGRLSHACKAAEGCLAPISKLKIRRRAFFDACRTLAKPQKAIWLRFQSSEFVDAPFSTLVARLQSRRRLSGSDFKAQNPSTRLFRRLSHACKAAEGYLAPISELRIHRRAFVDACRTLAKPQKAIWLQFQSSESIDAPLWTLVARLQSRRRLSGSDFRAQNSSTRLFRRLSHACKAAEGCLAPISKLKIRRRAFFDACRTLAKPQKAIWLRFQSSESIDAPLWTLVARLQSRRRLSGSDFRAQNPSTRLFGRLSHACKAAEGYLAPISELRIHRRAFVDACRTLAKPQKAIWLRFQSSESIDAPFWTLVARLQSRRRLSGSNFRAQNPSTRLFGRLSHACKAAEGCLAPISELRIRRRGFFDACRTLAKPQKAVWLRFQSSEFVDAPFSTLVARLQSRRRLSGSDFRAQNPSTRLFGRLSHACKAAEGCLAPISELRIRRRAFFDACRTLAKPQKAVWLRFQSSESIDAPFWTLVARLQSRRRLSGSDFRAQNPSTRLFGRLSHACKAAEGCLAPISELRIRRRAFLDACRTLAQTRHPARLTANTSQLSRKS